MGKHLLDYHFNDQLEDSYPSCISGIFHVLHYHNWHKNVRKLLPLRRLKQRKNCKRNKIPKTNLGVHDTGEALKLLDAEEASDVLVNQCTAEKRTTQKRSLKSRIRALIAEEIRKEDEYKKRGPDFPAGSRLRRTLSIHHLEAAEYEFSEKSNDWKNPIIFLPKKPISGASKLQHPARITATDWEDFDTCTKEILIDYLGHHKLSQIDTYPEEKCAKVQESSMDQAHANLLMQNASRRQVKKYADVLELFQVNKELFQEVQQNNDDGKATGFQMPKVSNTKPRLTKSGTFPAASFSYSSWRSFKPSKLEDKQTEVWSFPRGGSLRSGSRLSSFGLAQESVDLEWSEVITPLKDNLQRINDNKDEPNSISSGSFFGQVSNGYKPSTHGKEKNGIPQTSTMANDRSDSLNNRHRRTSSLNESLNRYAHLFEDSFNMKTNWNLSKSLKVTNENDSSSVGSTSIFLRRNHSLSLIDSYWSLENDESSRPFNKDMPSTTAAATRATTEDNTQSGSKPERLPVSKTCLELDAKEENVHLDTLANNIDSGNPEVDYLESSTLCVNDCDVANMDVHYEGIDKLTVERNNSYEDQQTTFVEIDEKKVLEPSPAGSVHGSHSLEEVTSHAAFSTSEDLDYGRTYSNERESPLNLLKSSDCNTTYTDNLENLKKSVKNHIHTKLHTDDDADLEYVRRVLELGFNEKGFEVVWFSSEQLLNPLIFDEVEESWWSHESEFSEENISVIYRHQLLFDLVNEVMVQIYERSFTYYPRALSSSCRIHSMHGRPHNEEVLKGIIKSHGLKPDQLTDDPVTQDLAKDDGWMNLQTESECVALELEDWIFEELLEELIYS